VRKQDSKLSETNVGTRRDAEEGQTSVKMRTRNQCRRMCCNGEEENARQEILRRGGSMEVKQTLWHGRYTKTCKENSSR